MALLLLFTQQMGFAHAISHLSELNSGSVQVKQMPPEQACDHCLAFAQVGSALGSDPASFKATAIAAEVALGSVTKGCISRTVCVFQSRAPPAVN
jgi:hypothetical protein